MTQIESFIESEQARMNWFDRLTGNYPRVETTSSILNSPIPERLQPVTRIKPTLFVRIAVVIFCLISSPMLVSLMVLIARGNDLLPVLIVAVLFLGFIYFIALKYAFFDKKLIYTIAVHHAGISLDKTDFLWQDIAETGIMYLAERRRHPNMFLVILFKDGTAKKCDLFNFSWSTDQKLARVIEYYKAHQSPELSIQIKFA